MKTLRKINIFKNSSSTRCFSCDIEQTILIKSSVSEFNQNILNSQDNSILKNELEKPTSPKSQEYETARYNEYGIQMISHFLHRHLFKNQHIHTNGDIFKNCSNTLKKFNLGNRKEPYPDVSFSLPKLCGKTIEEHFYLIGESQSSPYKVLINSLLSHEIPPLPDKWVLQSGWTCYYDGKIKSVPYPPEDALVFDVEVCKSEGEMPTMAVAVSKNAWYGWVSDSLVGGSIHYNRNNYTTDLLIPLESSLDASTDNFKGSNLKPRIIVGHNVSFDRSRVKEQYWLKRSALRFIDTLSLHVCISGITSYQKALLKAGVEGEEWSKLSSLNSLSKVHELYCGSKVSKEERNMFVEGSLYDIRNEFQALMSYCASDVAATYRVLKTIWPLFLSRFPHPVTLAGMLELQTAFVPVSENWEKYKSDSQLAYEDLTLEAKYLLSQTAKSTCKLFHKGDFKNDLWMWDQDWNVRKLKLKKTSKCLNQDSVTPADLSLIDEDVTANMLTKLQSKFDAIINKKHLLPVKKPLIPGYPQWYVKLCEKPSIKSWLPGPNLINNGMQITPKLLRLKWKSLPLHYIRGKGWGFLVPFNTEISVEDSVPYRQFTENYSCVDECLIVCSCESDCLLQNKADNFPDSTNDSLNVETFCKHRFGEGIGFVKLPHKDGKHLNVGNPLARDFITKFSASDLKDTLTNTKRIIEISKMLSYWRNNKERIESQLVIWLSEKDFPSELKMELKKNECNKVGVILPLLVVSGTLTRRAVEPTWMTASNAVSDRVGSEFRGIIQTPPGYCFVGADVDSQELWIASLLGDAYAAGSHGCTPFGWMTLNGHKSDLSDLHSVTAKAVGISRSHAKVLNYARIYGAGLKFAERTLLNFNPSMTVSEAKEKSQKMYQLTKGKKLYILKDNVLPELEVRKFSRYQANQLCLAYNKTIPDLFQTPKWYGGTESEMFNSLECIASKATPETPFLSCKLSRALEPNVDSEDKHGNTRVNWVVQSSAVDFLHLMLVCMKWLMGNDARFSISFHDEVRYLVPTNKKYQAALALQITNLLTRSFCVSRVGMTDLPLSVAFFSSVEIDTVLRKDSSDDNTTPSNPRGLTKGYGVPHGESLDINMCLDKIRTLNS